MITYVNTVLVGTGVGNVLTAAPSANATKSSVTTHVGKYVVENVGDTSKFRVGLVTGASYSKGMYYPTIKWSNDIKVADIKSFTFTEYAADTEDAVYIDLSGATASALQGNRLVVRITYKDLPTRFRKWTESYEIEVGASATLAQIAKAIADKINSEDKRARVTATVGAINTTSASNNGALPDSKYYHIDSNWGTSSATTGAVIQLVAMPYDDDDTVDSISPANKVRFTVNSWFTKPAAAGFASKNKYSVDGAKIIKVPGKFFTGSAKLVRDAEAQAMGYQGILNRGEGTWPIIKPGMNVDLNGTYDVLTLEFENEYRAADDIFRKTKQTLQVFEKSNATKTIDASQGLQSAIQAMIDKEFIKSEIRTKAESDAAYAPHA